MTRKKNQKTMREGNAPPKRNLKKAKRSTRRKGSDINGCQQV